MDCEQAANFISARIDGEITSADEAVLDAHLSACAACQAALESAAVQDAAMVRAFAGGREAAAALAAGVEHAFSKPVAQVGRRATRWIGWAGLAAAAAAAAIVGVVLFVRPAAQRPVQQVQVTPQPPPAAAETIAQLALVTGEVFTCPSGKATWEPVASGEKLAAGAKLRTADAAKCEIDLPGGSKLRLNSATELQLAAAQDVHLTGGQIFSAVPADATPIRIAAGQAQVTTSGAAAQVDVSRVSGGATVTVVDGCAVVDSAGQAATTVRGGELLRVGMEANARFGCEPVDDPVNATRWLDDLLLMMRADNEELQRRVDVLLGRIVAEGQGGDRPGPIEREVRARGQAWSPALAHYARDRLEATAEAELAKCRAAARLLADVASTSCVAEMIPLIGCEDAEVRFHAAAALKRLTGQTLGFSPAACAASPRDPAPLLAWQQWWASNRSRYPAVVDDDDVAAPSPKRTAAERVPRVRG